MTWNRRVWKQCFLVALFAWGCMWSARSVAQSGDPCVDGKRRALVLSGGGSKGAFETGAIYHLVVQRHCDFHEFSGVSVGALNGAFLAQAAPSQDPSESFGNLAARTEGLVSLWQSVKSAKDIRKARRLAMARFGLFGAESLSDFGPLRQLLDRNISIEKLAEGRPVRAGVVSFWSGSYREVLAQPLIAKAGARSFMEYLFASSVPPVYGKLPRIADGSMADDPKLWSQFSDGSLRHITPVASYFKTCGSDTYDPAHADAACPSNSVFAAPPHSPVEQLFVIVTSPYARNSDSMPPMEAGCCRPGRHQITDGRKILGRTIALMDDAVYRSDLDFLYFANDLLRWRRQTYEQITLNSDPGKLAETRRQFMGSNGFAFESYNRDPQDADAPSRPYEIGLVIPDREFADPEHLLVITPAIIREQLLSGCLAADAMMQRDFHLSSMADQCAQRFPSGVPNAMASREFVAPSPKRTGELAARGSAAN